MTTKFIDLFCGVGGFRLAADWLEWECVFSSDIDAATREVYRANFGSVPSGDIRSIEASALPDHDILFAGFPFQPFSIIGEMRGTDDARGTLFFEIIRILQSKRPTWFVLENVKQLVGNNGGRTLNTILKMTEDLGYSVDWNVLNALDFGLPQKRERVFIVGNTGGYDFKWPEPGIPMTPLSDILESTVDDRFFVSERIKNKRHLMHTSEFKPGLWHENKSGHVSSYPYSCALRAGASYNYLLVDGERRLTPREMFSLQGFPEWFEIRCNDSQSRKQAGNTVAIPVVRAVICQIVLAEAQEETYGTSAKTEATDQAAVPSKSISE